MALARFDLCQSTAGNITTGGLEPRGKLFLGQFAFFPDRADPLSHLLVIAMIHAGTSLLLYKYKLQVDSTVNLW